MVVEADSTEDGQTARNSMIKECVVQVILAPKTQPREHLEGGQGKGRGHEISPFSAKAQHTVYPRDKNAMVTGNSEACHQLGCEDKTHTSRKTGQEPERCVQRLRNEAAPLCSSH